MILWCSHCQRFLGESAPYEDLSVHHIVCAKCHNKSIPTPSTEAKHQKDVKRMMYSLWQAGTSDDIKQGVSLIEEAQELGLHPADIAMGILTPLLYEIGSRWEKGLITVADEHRFSAFVEALFAMMSRRSRTEAEERLQERKTELLLMNADGNTHDLGIRVLEMWFQHAGVPAKALIPTPSKEELKKCIEAVQPRFIGISIALKEQVPNATEMIQFLHSNFDYMDLQILVGGYAVKKGWVDKIPGALLIPDVRMFETLRTDGPELEPLT